MIKKNRFSGWLSKMHKTNMGILYIVLLVAGLAVLLTTCAGGTDGEGAGVFTLVTGSGTVTLNVKGAYEDHEERNFFYGTVSTGTPIGSNQSIGSDDFLLTLADGETDITFTGGLELAVGGFIDVNNNGADFHMPDNGDWTVSKTVTVSGNETVTLTYPGDFTEVSGSGTVTVNVTGADLHNTETFYFGTTSTGEPIGGSTLISDGETSDVLQVGETNITFTGGLELAVGGFIDVNGNAGDTHMPDDGDWMASKTVTVDGNVTADLTYPGDFTEVSGSGTVSVNLKNANSAHPGKTFYYGTTSTGSPIGDSEVINSDGMLLTINDDGTDVEFAGGTELAVGGFIDVNGNGDLFHMPDDGDYQVSATVTVAGDSVVTLTY